MDNLLYITNAAHINKIFESAINKLIIVLFYIKTTTPCKNAKIIAEKLAKIHTNIIFILIDFENFSGESPYCKDIANLPRFDFFYSKTSLGKYSGYAESNIENNIRYCEHEISKSQSFVTINTPNVSTIPTPIYNPIPTQPIPVVQSIPSATETNMPNAQQIQRMFNIFQMMQQMGILNNQNILPTTNQKDKIEDEIILKNGDKLIPLSNGKYGLIKKK